MTRQAANIQMLLAGAVLLIGAFVLFAGMATKQDGATELGLVLLIGGIAWAAIARATGTK